MKVNGTTYHDETEPEIVAILERLRSNQTRVRFHWGDVKTGEDWGDEYDVKGRIGRSTGTSKIPILLYNTSSNGGGAILDHCIVKISETRGVRLIYQHPNYHLSQIKE